MLAELDVDVVCLQEIEDDTAAEVLGEVSRSSDLEVIAYEPGTTVVPSGTAVLSRLEGVGELGVVGVFRGEGEWRAAVARVITPAGWELRVCSTHLRWGGRNEHQRVEQVVRIDADLCARGGVDGTVLAGDMNAVPEAASMRYLRGVEPIGGACAQWTDAWLVAGQGDGYTSSPKNRWAVETGRMRGFLRPEMLPERRIDYIYIEGYAHGRIFAPLECRVVNSAESHRLEPSDHWAVVADLYDPARP